jgi:hypothetical protein
MKNSKVKIQKEKQGNITDSNSIILSFKNQSMKLTTKN